MTPASEAAAPIAFEAPTKPVEPEDEMTIRVEGIFDGATAWDLRTTLERSRGKARTVVLDFTRVREFYDFGVGVLAHWLAQRTNALPRVSLRGLRTHQARMFRYFGVDTGN
jgi:anti-anti-sigma regulatory factor